MKKIEFEIDNITYRVQLTRRIIKEAEDKGYSIADFEKKPIGYCDTVLELALIANNADVNKNNVKDIMDKIGEEYDAQDVSEAIATLINDVFINDGTKKKVIKNY